jgi:hypothetical protein
MTRIRTKGPDLGDGADVRSVEDLVEDRCLVRRDVLKKGYRVRAGYRLCPK